MSSSRCCRYCQPIFQPSRYRPQQNVCSRQECQRRRRSEHHGERIRNDSAYAADVRPTPQRDPAQSAAATTARSETPLVNLAKMNLALDLKHEASEVWFVGPVVKHLAKNNLAQSKILVPS